jgi:hypothetical protein
MKKQLRTFSFKGFALSAAIFATSLVPASAQSIGIGGDAIQVDTSFGMTIFGYHLNNHQTITLFAVVAALVCSYFLYQRVVMRECGCCCGPGKCECGCGCRQTCPCFYRDKSAHNDRARRTRNDWDADWH